MENNALYIVTGASGGMGQVLTEQLALKGYRVVMACRNLEKAEPICCRIRLRSGNPHIRLMLLDLASLESIRYFTDTLQQEGEPIAVLINNAGAIHGSFTRTADGLEQSIGVNYVGAFALTLGLLPLMQPGSRILNTLSCTYRIGRVNATWMTPDPQNYKRLLAYGNSKLALLLFTLTLNETLRNERIHVYAVDPGIVDTGIITMGCWFDPLVDLLFRPLIKSAAKGAATALELATGVLPCSKHAIYWADMQPRRIARRILNHPYRDRLIRETEQLTGLKMPDNKTLQTD